jgi:predicted nucleic acid-binding protein
LIIAVDTNILLYFLDKNVRAPTDASTGEVIEDGSERIRQLVAEIEKAKGRIIVPTPVLAEILVKAGAAGPSWLAIMEKSAVFRIAEFDKRAAFEFAQLHIDSLAKRKKGEEKRGIKFDDQILAISRINGATILYSDDKGIKSKSTEKLKVVTLAEMLPPKSDPQLNLDFQAGDGGAKS